MTGKAGRGKDLKRLADGSRNLGRTPIFGLLGVLGAFPGHPERSEGSRQHAVEILRCAQNDRGAPRTPRGNSHHLRQDISSHGPRDRSMPWAREASVDRALLPSSDAGWAGVGFQPRENHPDLSAGRKNHRSPRPGLLTTGPSPQRPASSHAIQTALANSQVVRVLAGVTAAASGSTIYDPAITQTTIDQAKARFDPMVNVNNSFARQNPPVAAFDPLDPTRAIIEGAPAQSYDMNLGVSKVNSLGGTASLAVDVNPTRTRDGLLPLNPQTRSSIQLSYTQPLLQGAGVRVNLAPIVIARLNTERSFFQFKDNVQQSVRGVIQAYWSLVFARTDTWARRRQVEQGEQALLRAEGKFRAGLADVSEVAQARTALANFKATLIGSQANVLNQEAALANIMKLDPATHLIPLSPPSGARLKINWDEIVRLAGENRPDLIELKLILEADDQMLLQARNQARPQLKPSIRTSRRTPRRALPCMSAPPRETTTPGRLARRA